MSPNVTLIDAGATMQAQSKEEIFFFGPLYN